MSFYAFNKAVMRKTLILLVILLFSGCSAAEPESSVIEAPSGSPEPTYTPSKQVTWQPPPPTPTPEITPTPSPTPVPTLFPAYIMVYPRAMDGGEPVRIELGPELSQELEDIIKGPRLTINTEPKVDYYLYSRIFMRAWQYGEERDGGISVSNKGYGVVHVGDYSYEASEFCQKILKLAADKMKLEYETREDVHDLTKAELFDKEGGKLLKSITDPQKLYKLERLLADAIPKGFPSTYWVGPKLVLTREDGKKLIIWPTVDSDFFLFEPWYFYDLGDSPTGESQNYMPMFLSIFGMADWPQDVKDNAICSPHEKP